MDDYFENYEQLERGARLIGAGVAAFYNTLISNGVPHKDATILAATWINSLPGSNKRPGNTSNSNEVSDDTN